MNRNGSQWFRRERFDLTRPFEAETKSRPINYLQEDGYGRVQIVPTTTDIELKFAPLLDNPIPGDEENAQASLAITSTAATSEEVPT